MYKLRERTLGKSDSEKMRAFSGRMITDIEMNGTTRGAVEVFNLASNMREGDALFPEFIRTFPTRDLDARSWLHRLNVEIQKTETATTISLVPITKTPQVRTERGTPPYPECYGFRPQCYDKNLQCYPWKYLCAYEFMMFWHCEPLIAPYLYERNGVTSRTQWTTTGKAQYNVLQQEHKEKSGKRVLLLPGKHYTVVEDTEDPPQYFLFPNVKNLEIFRNAWVLVRNKRPYVPVLEGMRIPSSESLKEEDAKYCNVFFRPWSLLEGTADVPELRLLGTPPSKLRKAYADKNLSDTLQFQRHRLPRKRPAEPASTDALHRKEALQWKSAWEEYIHGSVNEDEKKKGIYPLSIYVDSSKLSSHKL